MNGHVGSDEHQSDADEHGDLHDEIPPKSTVQTPAFADDGSLADNPEHAAINAMGPTTSATASATNPTSITGTTTNIGNNTGNNNNVPPKSVEGYKKYYRIGEVAAMLDVEPHVLRYWESRFSQVAPVKSPSNQRLYRYEDLVMLKRIQKLVQEQGYSIDGAKLQLEKWLRAEKRLDKLDRQEKLDKTEETTSTTTSITASTTSSAGQSNIATTPHAENNVANDANVAAVHAAQSASKNTNTASATAARTHTVPVRGFGHAERTQLEELRREVADALSWLRQQR